MLGWCICYAALVSLNGTNSIKCITNVLTTNYILHKQTNICNNNVTIIKGNYKQANSPHHVSFCYVQASMQVTVYSGPYIVQISSTTRRNGLTSHNIWGSLRPQPLLQHTAQPGDILPLASEITLCQNTPSDPWERVLLLSRCDHTCHFHTATLPLSTPHIAYTEPDT